MFPASWGCFFQTSFYGRFHVTNLFLTEFNPQLACVRVGGSCPDYRCLVGVWTTRSSAVTPDSHNTHHEAHTGHNGPDELNLLLTGHFHLDLLSVYRGCILRLAATACFPFDADIVAISHLSASCCDTVVQGWAFERLPGAEAWKALKAIEPPFYALATQERDKSGPEKVWMLIAARGESECRYQRKGGDGCEC